LDCFIKAKGNVIIPGRVSVSA